MRTAIGRAMFARFHEAATVRGTSHGWEVVAFEPTFVEMGTMRKLPQRPLPVRNLALPKT
jgi:hypothetical protein